MNERSHIIRRKRKANCFIIYRTELLKHRPKNIKMTDFSKVVSALWKTLDDQRKETYRRKYEVNKHNSEISRSEEHTSELQSLAYLVCRLLLEKKKII